MTIQHFSALSQHKQHRYLLMDGSCIAERKEEDAQVLLFQLGDFYVEVFFTFYGDEVISTKIFEGTEELEPYLNSLGLKNLQE
jgi:hypothetical protein